jgi:transposase
MRSDVEIEVSAGDRARLEAIVAAPRSPQKHVWRARIILLSGDGVGTMAIARQAGVAEPTVWRWQERFMTEGVAGLLREKSRPPGIAPLPAETVDQVLTLTGAPPPGEATHWTVRAMAKAVGISRASVQRIWQAHGLQPHRLKAFKLSRDPAFAAKLRDIVGLYVDPPAHAVVLSVDEKSQIQALDRTQPGLPIKPGRLGTMTHDYKRHGTTTLFAALNILEGTLIGRCMARHRHQEFIRFLNAIEAAVPAGKVVHVILDNYGTTSTPRSAPGSPAIRVSSSTSRRPRARGSTPSRPSSPSSPGGDSGAGCSARSSTCRLRSTASSRRTTMTPSRSSGPPTPTASSKASDAGIKRWRQSTSWA